MNILISGGVDYSGSAAAKALLKAGHQDTIYDSLATGKKRGYCGHPEIELALMKLYHATQNPRELKLTTYFIDERGQEPLWRMVGGRTFCMQSTTIVQKHRYYGDPIFCLG